MKAADRRKLEAQIRALNRARFAVSALADNDGSEVSRLALNIAWAHILKAVHHLEGVKGDA